jgi:protein-L-isoaspartate O-methyltransferase
MVRDLPEGTRVLEVALGPGYFAVTLARTGRVRVTGLDIRRHRHGDQDDESYGNSVTSTVTASR